MHRYLHVTIGYEFPAAANPKVLEPLMGLLSRDWLRYSTNAWLLWTDQSIEDVTKSLRAALLPNDFLMIMAMNPHETPGGQAPNWVWEWINRKRDPATGAVSWPLGLPSPKPPTYPGITPPFDISGLAGVGKLLGRKP